MWYWYETMNIGTPLGFVSWKPGLQTMHMLQSLAAPKKKRQVILIFDLIRVNYMSSLLYLLQNVSLGVGLYLEDSAWGCLDLTHCKWQILKFMNYNS